MLLEDSAGFEIVVVQSGARSIRSRSHGETFHPVVGPQAEAQTLHVAQQRFAERAAELKGEPLVVWDVGLGAAANACAALKEMSQLPPGAIAELHSFDLALGALEYALQVTPPLEYLAGQTTLVQELIEKRTANAANVTWHAHLGDFRETMNTPALPRPHAILYDPYSPKANPSLWSLECFAALRRRLGDGPLCTLTSYSRSTAVRVALLLAGFYVGRGCAMAEKEETTLAATELAALDAPLDAEWLGRVSRSTKGAPLRDGITQGQPISRLDMNALLAHPQFARVGA